MYHLEQLKMTNYTINIWGEFADRDTERSFLNHHAKERFSLNRLCILVSGIGYLVVGLGDVFRIGFCLNSYLTLAVRFAFFVFCLSVYFVLKYRLDLKLFRNLTFAFVLGNTTVLLLLIYLLNPDKSLDRIDELTVPFITLMLFILTQLSVRLLFVNGLYAFVAYLLVFVFVFNPSIDHFISLAGLLSVLISSGVAVARFVQKTKRVSFIQSQKIEQLNNSLSLEVKAKNEAQIKLLKTHNNLIDSIEYAKNLQLSFLPTHQNISQLLPEFFIFFQPCNIVSGDFYWVGAIRKKTVVAVADCTGHGVPAAFMSILGITLLNKLLKNIELQQNSDQITAASLLEDLKRELLMSLNQNNEMSLRKDGMDIALCIIDKENLMVQFAGAYSDMWLVSQSAKDAKIIRYRGDSMPIGLHLRNGEFHNHVVVIQPNDMIYLFTDGIIDQFGGDRHKRFMRKQFSELLLRCGDKSVDEQNQIIKTAFYDWKKDYFQIDDVLVMGIRVA